MKEISFKKFKKFLHKNLNKMINLKKFKLNLFKIIGSIILIISFIILIIFENFIFIILTPIITLGYIIFEDILNIRIKKVDFYQKYFFSYLKERKNNLYILPSLFEQNIDEYIGGILNESFYS